MVYVGLTCSKREEENIVIGKCDYKTIANSGGIKALLENLKLFLTPFLKITRCQVDNVLLNILN